MNVLIIEDDIRLANLIQSQLLAGTEIDIATTAKEGFERAHYIPYDIFLIDINLPDMDGIKVCKQIRSDNQHAPILIISAVDSVEIKVKALDAGANDYIVKPFNISELNARIRAIARYMSIIPENVKSADKVTIDPTTRIVKRAGKSVKLTKKEFEILHYMMRHAGKVVSRNMLIDYVWGSSSDTCSNSIDVHFSYLRNKIDKPFAKKLLHTVHGIGYIFKSEAAKKGGDKNEKINSKSANKPISAKH